MLTNLSEHPHIFDNTQDTQKKGGKKKKKA